MMNASLSDPTVESPKALLQRAVRRIGVVATMLVVLALAHHVDPAAGVQHAGAEAQQQLDYEG